MHPVLRLYEDVLSSAENVVPIAAAAAAHLRGAWLGCIGKDALDEGKAWQGEAPVTVKPGPTGSPAGAGSWRAAITAAPRPMRRA